MRGPCCARCSAPIVPGTRVYSAVIIALDGSFCSSVELCEMCHGTLAADPGECTALHRRLRDALREELLLTGAPQGHA